MKSKVPYLSEEEAAPLQRIIRDTALATGASEHQALTLFTHFWEGVIRELARDNAVKVPGFGLFYVYRYTPRKKGLEPFPRPAFYFARGATNEVRKCSPPFPTSNEALVNYKHNHTPHVNQTEMGFTAMDQFRKYVLNDALRIGQNIEFHPDV